MKSFLFFIFLVIILSENPLKIWPYPLEYKRGNNVKNIDSTIFKFISPNTCSDMENAFIRFNNLIFSEHIQENKPVENVLNTIIVTVDDDCKTDLQVFLFYLFSLV